MDKRSLRSNSSNSSPAVQESMKGVAIPEESPVTLVHLKAALADCVSQINERIDKVLDIRLEKLRCDLLSDFEKRINRLKATIITQEQEIQALKAHCTGVDYQVDSLAYTLHLQMKKEIENNIVISGVPEVEDESVIPSVARNVLKKLDCSNCEIRHHSRVGKSQNSKPRLLKISFRFLRDKAKATRNASHLREDASFRGVYVNSDLTFCERRERRRLRDAMDEIRKEKPAAEIVLRRGELLVDGVTVDSALPHRLLFRG